MTFSHCAIGSRDRVWFTAEEEDTFRLLQLKKDSWAVKSTDWAMCSVCGIEKSNGKYEVIALGTEGNLLMGIPGGFSEGHLDPKLSNPKKYGVLRDIRIIGDDIFACGMSRQVYHRIKGNWKDIAGKIKSETKEALGFNSIDGISSNAVYAVGFKGEIWFYDGAEWIQLNSPVLSALHYIRATPDGRILICGAEGTLLEIKKNKVTVIPNEITTSNLYSICHFKGRIFVSSLTAIYEIDKNGLKTITTNLKGSLTFGHLEANEDIMYCVGAKHIFTTEDGNEWNQIFCEI